MYIVNVDVEAVNHFAENEHVMGKAVVGIKLCEFRHKIAKFNGSVFGWAQEKLYSTEIFSGIK